MKYTLWGVGAIVVVGIVVALFFLLAPPAGTSDTAEPSSAATPSITRGPSPGATPEEGSEVLPPDPSSTPGSGLPPLPVPEPLVTAPLPESAAADGVLVDGFPGDVMGPAAGSDILSSSIATESDVMQVTLVARTDATQEEVSAHFRSLWAELGLTEGVQTEGSADITSTDQFSSLSLAFTPSSGTGTVYMIFGVFRTS